MPRYTLAEAQAECITLGSSLLLAAELMQPQNAEEDLGIGDDDGVSSEESDWDEEEDTEQEETFGGDEEDEIMLQAVGIYLLDYGDSLLGNGKRGPYFQFPKSKDYFECCLNANDRDFRYHFRMGREMFYRLVAMLEPNPIFHSTGPKPQRPVEYQLGAFLYRYGTLGSDAVGAAHKTGIGYGSVINYCWRVTRAIRELRDKYVGFLSEEEQQATMDRIICLCCAGYLDCRDPNYHGVDNVVVSRDCRRVCSLGAPFRKRV
ncbi:hypothetical protein VKT23_011951 [Stygiomarasmius scandens]|uniref:Uncharacterized protein n=1 Tax=Marasmiellus scandens TaxID=2682957 RepID=A0ABR1JAT0_9AGAR